MRKILNTLKSGEIVMTKMIQEIYERYQSGNKNKTLKHVQEVAKTAEWLAQIHQADIEKAKLAALLHDISAIVTPQEMYETIKERNMPLCEAEEKYPFLLHQRVSRIIAQEKFGIEDEEILSAIECHTTLKKDAGVYDKIVFIADKISWDQEGTPPYFDQLKKLVQESLDEACFYYIHYQFEHHLLLMPHDWIIDAYEDLKIRLDN